MLAWRRRIIGRRRAFSVARQNEQTHNNKGFWSMENLCFGEVDEAHVQGGVLLPQQLLQTLYHEHHVNRRALRSEPTLFTRHHVSQ